eukprot:6079276-Amphidinium_carterae.2
MLQCYKRDLFQSVVCARGLFHRNKNTTISDPKLLQASTSDKQLRNGTGENEGFRFRSVSNVRGGIPPN